MTSSINFKKLVSVGAALLIAIGGSLGAVAPANAAAATSAPSISGSALSGSTITANPAVWGSGSGSGKWYVCGHGGSMLASTSVPSGCEALYTSRLDTTPITSTTLTVPSIAYCATSCTPFGNSSIGSDFRWIEQNGSDISASAAVTVKEGRLPALSSMAVGDTFVSLLVNNGCSFTGSSITPSADWSLSVAGTARTITSIATSNNSIVLSFATALTSGQAVSVSYQQGNSAQISCGLTSAVANLTTPATGTVGSGNQQQQQQQQQQSGGTVSAAAAAPQFNNGTVTATNATWTGASNLLMRWWVMCSSPHAAASGGLGSSGRPTDCYPLYATALNNTPVQSGWFSTNPFTVPSTVNLYSTCASTSPYGCTTTVVSTVGKYLAWYETDMGAWAYSATVGTDGTVYAGGSQNSSVIVPSLTPEQAKNQIKPLPVIVQPLVAALPSLSKPLVDAGGKVDLKAGDFTGLVSASISGKTIDLTVGSTGSLTITVPNGKAGTTADLLLNFKSGTVILQDAINYVAPVVVAQVPVRPVSIKAGAKKLSATAADDIRHAAFANLKNNSIECVAYAASAATADAAKATAQQACDLAVKSNPELVNTSVVVVIDKIKAATQGVGIRVYKQ
jgi:hypothetical protein